MRSGTPIRAHLLCPVYAGSTLILSQDTIVHGTVTGLRPDRNRRLHARFNADFTPFRIPIVRFTALELADGTTLPLTTGEATDGAPIFRIVPPPPVQGSFLHRRFEEGKQALRDRLTIFTAPDKGERARQFLYNQLPYHPQHIAKGTAWTVETSTALTLAALPPQPAPSAATPGAEGPPTWMVQAYLNDPLTSATTKVGQPIKATVAEPLYNPDGSLAVPQGATLLGAVTRSTPARRFSRDGALSFSFRELRLPDGESRSVQTTLAGIDAASAANLAMDSEGEVKPKPHDKVIVPLALIFLAGRPLDRDGGEHMLGKDAVASNSLGMIGFIVGITARNANFAAGLGLYGAALSVFDRVLARGKQVTYPRDTRIVLQTTPRRSEAIRHTAN